MQDDEHIGGEAFIYELGPTPQEKSSRNNKHFTLIGITLLIRKSLMCVVIFVGKRCSPVVEMEIDPRAEEVGPVLDEDCIVKNCGKGKRFLEGTTYTYRGKDIHWLYQRNSKGSMTSNILKATVHVLDILEIFD